MNIIKDEILDNNFSLFTVYQLATLVVQQKIDLFFIFLKTSFTSSCQVVLSNVGDNQKILKVFSPISHGKRPITIDTILQHITPSQGQIIADKSINLV